MSSATTSSSAPFTRAVVNAIRKLYPEDLADKSWDNTGLLLEAPFNPSRRQRNSVLLTIDLTRAVADEAIARRDSIIIAYHPIIFRGLKSLSLQDSQQQSLLRLAAEGISVYSPHTAFDTAPGGIADWLGDIVTGAPAGNSDGSSGVSEDEKGEELEDPFTEDVAPKYSLQPHPPVLKAGELTLASVPHERSPITPLSHSSFPTAGIGRKITFSSPQPLYEIVNRISLGLGKPKGIPIAVPQNTSVSDIHVRAVGICPGSGGSVFSALKGPQHDDVDLLLTGELSHHEALAATERGRVVVSLFHSNSERGFLGAVLKDQLEARVAEEWDVLRRAEKEEGVEELEEALADEEVEVEASEVDRDPYGILIAS